MTNAVMIYRTGSKWHIMAAFTIAVTIHLSAVAIASLHHEEQIVNPGNEFPIINGDPGEQSPVPPQIEIPVETPPLASLEELVESQPPILKPRSLAPTRVVKQAVIGFAGNPGALAINAPRPEYPYEARSRHLTGDGVAELSIDPVTGLVENAIMKQSTRSTILDNAAISAFKRWRFKPGAGRKILVPISFLITGAAY